MKEMSDFVGYTKRPEPKWPYFVLFLAVSIILFFAFATNSINEISSLNNEKGQGTNTKGQEDKNRDQGFKGSRDQEDKKENILKPRNLETSKPSVEQILFTSGINDYYVPIDNISSASKSKGELIYCYTKINSPVVPTILRHVWVNPKGEVHADIKLNLINQPGNLWSYIGAKEKQTGKWIVAVKDSYGNTLAQKEILITN